RRSGITPQTVSLQPTGEFEGSDGQWSTFAVSVGSDNQPFRVLVSTSSPSTWIPREGSCSNGNPPSNCTGLRGIEANFGTKSQGYQLAPSKELDQGVYPLKVGNDDTKERYGPSFDMAARFANDSISLSSDTGNDVTLDSQVIAAFVTNKTLLGTLGLYWGHNTFGRVSVGSMFSTIPNSTTSFRPSLSYGYTAGAVYSPPKFLGSLVIGGYDSSRFDPSPYSYELDKTTKEMRLSVQSIKAVYKSGSDALDLSRESYELERHTVLLDSTLPYMFLPRSICDRFEEVLGLTYDNRTGLYLMDEANRSKHRDLNTTIQFNLADAYSSASITRISLPFVALDLEASWPTVPNGNHTRFFPIRRGVASDKYILGRAFMQEAYIIVDYERGNFSVAQSRNFGPAPSPNIIAITSPHTKEKEGGLGAGALAGIGIGATVVVIAMCALAWYLFKGRQKKTPKIELDGTAVEPEKPPADRDQDRRHTVFSIASSELPGSPVPRISMPGIA
ncbi:acid protease, partial [Eremomyces bilateralis CBS 781.70]